MVNYTVIVEHGNMSVEIGHFSCMNGTCSTTFSVPNEQQVYRISVMAINIFGISNSTVASIGKCMLYLVSFTDGPTFQNGCHDVVGVNGFWLEIFYFGVESSVNFNEVKNPLTCKVRN